MNRDDALEWFGGTADIKYAVASNAADDSFDWTFGWSGRAQFIAIHQRGDDADNGIEADNNEFNNNLLPRSNPQIYNITLCGDPDRTKAPRAPRAANLRRGTAFTIRNFLVTGFKTTGFQIETTNTRRPARSTTARRRWAPAWSWGIATPDMHASVDALHHQRPVPERPAAASTRRWLSRPAASITTTRTSSRRRSATLAGGQLAPIQPPNDGFFEAVTFIGAVPPAPADDWTRGWTSFPQR